MASDDDSQALDTHHDEKEWEEQKENFRICYIDNNMTRKDAAEYMKQHFNFNATPRQWERKIKQWGFSKYTGRDERLAQIAQTGKTVLDVSRPGRRARPHLDEYGNLHPNEDRNLRRFARREVSRSRSRSRSTSITDRPRPQFQQQFSDPSVNTTLHPPFDFNDMGSEMRRTPSMEGAPITRERAQTAQSTFYKPQQTTTYEQPDGTTIAAAIGQTQWMQAQQNNSQQFDANSIPNHYSTFSNSSIPLHTSQAMNIQATNQPFAGNDNNTAFGFPMPNPPMQSLPADFNQYAMSDNHNGMHSAMLPEDMMNEQRMFDDTVQLPQGHDSLDQTDFEDNPMITFDLVDMDSGAMIPPSGPAPPQDQSGMAMPLSNPISGEDGPLRTDVLPLIEQYTRAVQTVALGSLMGSSHADRLANKLAADLDQPSKQSHPYVRVRV